MSLDQLDPISFYLEKLEQGEKIDQDVSDLVEVAEEVYGDEILGVYIQTDQYTAAIARAEMYDETVEDLVELMEVN